MIHDFTPLSSFVGGVLIGLAALWMMLAQGRIAGISGICGGLLQRSPASEWSWRAAFVVGLIGAGLLAGALGPAEVLEFRLSRSPTILVLAGLLVGFGTRLGGGCTSGHGVCGLGRLAPRSTVATLVFMGVGMVTAAAVTHLFGGAL